MKEGLDCDARVLRMRYSSQDWVSQTPGALSFSHLPSHGVCERKKMLQRSDVIKACWLDAR